MKPYQIIVSSHANFNTYYTISSYDTLQEAQEHYESDLEQFHKDHRQFWLSECYGYDAIIKDTFPFGNDYMKIQPAL